MKLMIIKYIIMVIVLMMIIIVKSISRIKTIKEFITQV